MVTVEFWQGPPASGKTTEALRAYLDVHEAARKSNTIPETLWLTPAFDSVRETRRRLLVEGQTPRVPALFDPGVSTFEGFAEKLLMGAGLGVTPLSSAAQRRMVRRIVREEFLGSNLPHYGPVASMSGFLDQLLSTVGELKRAEVWPDAFEKAIRRHQRVSPKDRELAVLYRRYQDVLSQSRRYDATGRFWLARTALQERLETLLPLYDLVVVDGFTDFTHTQYEMLGLIAQRSRRLILTLANEPHDDRSELFSATRRAKARVTSECPVDSTVKERWFEVRSETPAGLQTIARSLFGNPRNTPPSDTATGVELLATTGATGEMEAIGLRIKHLLETGIAPSQILVAVRDLEITGRQWAQAWQAAGIPADCPAVARLSEKPLIQSIIHWLQVELDDWSFPKVQGFLTSNHFHWLSDPSADRAWRRQGLRLLRKHKLHGGREGIFKYLRRLQASWLQHVPQNDAAQSSAADLNAIHHLIELHDFLSPLRQKQTWQGWIDVLTVLAERLLVPAVPADEETQTNENSLAVLDRQDRADWDFLQGTLRVTREGETETDDTLLSLSDFVSEFRDLVDHETMPVASAREAAVRILTPEQTRSLDAPYLFFASLTEQAFPRGRSDDCLLSESDRRELSQQGCTLTDAAARQHDELLLFYGTLLRARRHVVLSYPAVDANGQPVYASPYVASVQWLFTPTALPLQRSGRLDPVPAITQALGPADTRLAAVDAALHGDAGYLRTLFQQPDHARPLANYFTSIATSVARFRTPQFTEFEGRLGWAANSTDLQRRYGPHHQYSVTQLETYADCRFRFWMHDVVRVRPLLEPEIATDTRARGELLHEIVAELLRELGPVPPGELLHQRFLAHLSRLLDQLPSATELQQALLRIEAQLLTEWGAAYVEQSRQYAEGLEKLSNGVWKSLAPELSFGKQAISGAPGDFPEITFGTDENLTRLGGRIDRIDVVKDKEEAGFVVIDYKTGQHKAIYPERVASGKSLQLAMYLVAARRLGLAGTDAIPLQCGYWHISTTGFSPGVKGTSRERTKMQRLDVALLTVIEETLDEVIPRLARSIRQGQFEVWNDDPHCTGRCPYATICRVNQIRAVSAELGKSLDTPPAPPNDDAL